MRLLLGAHRARSKFPRSWAKPRDDGADDIPQPNGAEKATNVLASITDKEKTLLDACVKGLKGNIEKGITFAHNPPQK